MSSGLDMVTVTEDGHGVPILFPLGLDGVAAVSAFRLGIRFHLRADFVHVDQEIYDGDTG